MKLGNLSYLHLFFWSPASLREHSLFDETTCELIKMTYYFPGVLCIFFSAFILFSTVNKCAILAMKHCSKM